MMTLDEIKAARINPAIAREAYSQASQRLADALATKTGHEQKAFGLLTGYVTVSLALFSVFGFLAGSENDALAPPFLVAGFMFVLGAAILVVSIWDSDYGTLGSDPKMWLEAGIIDGNDAVLSTMLAYVVYHHAQRIEISANSNRAKARRIRLGIGVGVVALLVLGGWIGYLG